MKNEHVEIWSLLFLKMTQDLNKIKEEKKSQTPFCRKWSLGNVCVVSAKNIEVYGSYNSTNISKNMIS